MHKGIALALSMFFGTAGMADDRCVPLAAWFDVGKGEILSQTKLLQHLKKQKVVLLGEDHDKTEHHRWQLSVISQLHALEPGLALGFEAFPRKVQPVLDRWIRGELSDAEFLDAVDWRRNWNFDANIYLPLFHYARLHRIPLYAMNVERELISEVGAKGWEKIPKPERRGIGDPATASAEYVDMLAEVFTQHGHGGHEQEKAAADIKQDPSFLRFIQSQQVWDRAMAEVAHEAVTKDDKPMFVGVLGAGHIMGGHGVPHQLRDLGTRKVLSLMPWDGVIECEQLAPGFADYAFGLAQRNSDDDKKSHPLLGVYLEEAENGVGVRKVVKDSVAEKTGIRDKDVIVTIAGRPAREVKDVIEQVKATAFGTWLPLTIRRDGETLELVAKFPPQ